MDLDGYTITFRQNAIFGTWSWQAKTPNDEALAGPLLGLGWTQKTEAERDALRRIRRHEATERISGAALEARVTARST